MPTNVKEAAKVPDRTTDKTRHLADLSPALLEAVIDQKLGDTSAYGHTTVYICWVAGQIDIVKAIDEARSVER